MRRGLQNVLAVKATAAARGLSAAADNANPVAPTLALGDLTVGAGTVKSSADLLAGATDADGDALTITSVTAVSGGTVTGTGPWTIAPDATGAGSATVVISDGRGGSVNRTVTWNGIAANAVPVAAPLALGDLNVGTGVVKSSVDLLAGATDADGDALTITSVTAVSGGTVTGTGPWTITPTTEGAGAANVTISDGRGGTVVRAINWTGFSPGLWNRAAATASGGSQILGPNRYRIYSATGAISQVTVPAALVAGRAYQFQMTFETPVLGTQIQVGDAGGNVDDFVSSLAGTRTVAFVADGTVATLKRPYVVNAGQPTDVVVKNVAVTDITATALNITSQPQPRSIAAGSTTTFSVTVAAPFSAVHYSWEVSTDGGSSWAAYVDGTGAITNTLTTAAMTLGDNGELFRCRIRMGNANNTVGQIYSNAASLTVTAT